MMKLIDRMVIVRVEPNKTQIIQAISGSLPREVAELVTPQAYIWNETMDCRDVHAAPGAGIPAGHEQPADQGGA